MDPPKIVSVFFSLLMSLLATISKSISNLLLDKLSAALVEKFELDQEELNTFLQEFLAENLKAGKKAKGEKGPSKTNGYRVFSASKREAISKKVKADNENANNKEVLSLVSKELGAQWKKLSDAKKAEWNEKAKTQNEGGGAEPAETSEGKKKKK